MGRGNADLQAFMKYHLSRVQPEDVGLPRHTGRGHRPPGLSYGDLAQLMVMDTRTVGRIIRGETTPTEEQLERISTVLRLLPRERTHLFHIVTGRDPGPSAIERAGAGLSTYLKRRLPLLDATMTREHGHNVYGPLVYANALGWDLLVYNDPFTRMFFGGRPPQNTFKWICKYGAAQMPDHEERWLKLALPQLRAVLHKYPGHPSLVALERWCEETPGVQELWSQPEKLPSYQTPDGDIRPLIHGELGLGAMEMSVLAPHRVGEQDLRIFMMDFHVGVTPQQVRDRREEAAAGQKPECR